MIMPAPMINEVADASVLATTEEEKNVLTKGEYLLSDLLRNILPDLDINPFYKIITISLLVW